MPWDFAKLDVRQRATKLVRECKPLVVIGSPPCTAFSHIQHLKKRRRDPRIVAKELAEGQASNATSSGPGHGEVAIPGVGKRKDRGGNGCGKAPLAIEMPDPYDAPPREIDPFFDDPDDLHADSALARLGA